MPNLDFKQLGALHYFLGVVVKYLSNGASLPTHSKYIIDLLNRAQMAEAKSI